MESICVTTSNVALNHWPIFRPFGFGQLAAHEFKGEMVFFLNIDEWNMESMQNSITWMFWNVSLQSKDNFSTLRFWPIKWWKCGIFLYLLSSSNTYYLVSQFSSHLKFNGVNVQAIDPKMDIDSIKNVTEILRWLISLTEVSFFKRSQLILFRFWNFLNNINVISGPLLPKLYFLNARGWSTRTGYIVIGWY